MPNIKISGITNTKDAKWAALLGVEYISISLVKDSSKKVSFEKASDILGMLPSYTKTIVEIGDMDNDISLKKVFSLDADYLSIKDKAIINKLKDEESEKESSFILEKDHFDELLEDELPQEIKYIEINITPENIDSLKSVDFNNNNNIIINGDLELDVIKTFCKKNEPHAWSVRNIIERSPRRIDYKKMKKYIREISLL